MQERILHTASVYRLTTNTPIARSDWSTDLWRLNGLLVWDCWSAGAIANANGLSIRELFKGPQVRTRDFVVCVSRIRIRKIRLFGLEIASDVLLDFGLGKVIDSGFEIVWPVVLKSGLCKADDSAGPGNAETSREHTPCN